MWHARDADQVEGKETMLTVTVPVEKMIDDVMWMKRVDEEADEWTRTHASEVIFVDYEECKASPESCHTNMWSSFALSPMVRQKLAAGCFCQGK